MFERFDEGARQAVVIAQEQATLYSGIEINSVHLLAGVSLSRYIGKPGRPFTLGARVLRNMGLKDQVLKESVRENTTRRGINIPRQPEDDVPLVRIPFTSDASKSLELAFREAISLGHKLIRSEHIILGLVRCGNGHLLGVFADLPKRNVIRELMKESR